MIQLYPKGQTDFSVSGIELQPQEASVTWQQNGRYDFSMIIPREKCEGITFDYGMIIRASVPEEETGDIHLGTVSYYTVNADETPLYSKLPSRVRASYDNWEPLRSYMAGDKRTYDKKNWQCRVGHGGRSVPPPDGNLWTQISDYRDVPGTAAATLSAGTQIMVTAEFNDDYFEVATIGGATGYIAKNAVTSQGETEERVIPSITITEQCFEIIGIEKEESGHQIRITGQHVSYALSRTTLGECNIVGVSPATALIFIAGAMKESYAGHLYTDISEGTISADFSWKNAQAALLDPKAGLANATGGRITRDGLDVYLLANPDGTPEYEVVYGGNLKNVEWTGDVDGIVTRVYPLAQREDGSTLLLPEEHIDSVRTVPFVSPEVLNTGLKIGQKVTNSDGTEVELTEADVYARMREMAQNRFTVDQCDKAEVTLDLDWIHMPETEEYKAYQGMRNASPSAWIRVVNGPMGLDTVIQMTGYTFDPIKLRYKKATFGDQKSTPSVPGYQLASGAVTARALAMGSVGSGAIQASSITAREIEAGSITAEQIAARAITTELIQAGAVTAEEIAAQAITTEKLAAQSITTEKLAAGAITAEKIQSGSITTVLLAANAVTAEKIAAGAVNADKIAAGSISAQKIAAGAVTAQAIDAGAVTAEKIAAGAIDASKISATDLEAIQAKLEIASIASAQIGSADINYAQIKDLNAGSAYFGQAVIQQGLANKLYVPRLSVGYAQMIGATVGDLVIQASDGDFYALDVDLAGNVTATKRTVTPGEIASGHTNDGRQLVMDTDILAENLDTNNLTATHALMYSITANIIDVDQLWAREAFINKLNVQDLSSNDYIKSTVGNWRSESTITQTVNSLSSKISQLGYGTVYMQPDEPDHDHLSAGDIWVCTMTEGSWQEVYNSYDSWQEVYESVSTWQTLGGVPIMYVWDGQKWQQMYDALLPTMVETEILQLQDEITLRATKEELDLLSGEVTASEARITILADQIESAVSTVNAKAASFVMWEDPRTEYDVSLGDIWIRGDTRLASWESVYTYIDSWEELYEEHDRWMDFLGDVTYVWDGTQWIETSDRASEIFHQTKIVETDRSITLLAESNATLQGDVVSMRASISVTDSRITQEVERATQAEAGKIEKTTQYQTADEIVSAAVSEATSSIGDTYVRSTQVLQTAEAIVSEAVSQAASAASGAYLEKTTQYQSASGIVTEAVRVSGENADQKYLEKSTEYQTVSDLVSKSQQQANEAATTAKNASIAKTATYTDAQSIVNTAVASAATAAGQSYIAKTTTYQTADNIVSAAESYVNGQLTNYSTRQQTSTAIRDYVRDNAYGLVSGITITAQGVDVSGSQHVSIASGGWFKVQTGDFGIDTSSSGYVIWSGGSAASNSPFRVTKSGTVYLTKLIAVAENGTESDVNLRTAGLWKLGYHTIKSYGTNSITLSNNAVVNFNTAADVTLTGSWGTNVFEVSNSGNSRKASTGTLALYRDGQSGISTDNKIMVILTAGGTTRLSEWISASDVYTKGHTAGVTDGYNSARGSLSWEGGVLSVAKTNSSSGSAFPISVTISAGASIAYDPDTHKYTATGSAIAMRATRATATAESGTEAYSAGVTSGLSQYYNSNSWAKATAENNWLAKIPNETDTAAVDWDCGASAAYTAGGNAAWASAAAGSSSGISSNVITSKIPIPGWQYGTYTYTITADGSITGPNQMTVVAKVNGTGAASKVIGLVVNGLSAYSHAGETVYQYVEGKQVSFTIPSDCKTGTPTIGLAT